MGRYIGTAELLQYMFSSGQPTNTAQYGLLGSCINRAESAIDDYTRRNFAGTAGTVYYNRFAQARQFMGQALYLDQDLHTLIGVVNGDGQTIPVGSVWLEPRNLPPYRILRLKSSYVWVWNTDSDVIVSGTFGFGTTPPADVVQATVRYASWLFRQKDAGGLAGVDVAGFQEGGEVQYPKGMPDDVRYLLSPYRSRSGGIV